MNNAPFQPIRGDLYRTLYALIRNNGDTTRQYLADMTGLAPTSLNRALDRMMQQGWIVESGLADSTGGRRPNLYRLANDKIYLSCLILNGENASLALFDLNLSLLEERDLTLLYDETKGQFQWEALDPVWQSMLKDHGLTTEQIPGMAVVDRAPVNRDKTGSIDALLEKLTDLGKTITFIHENDSRLYAAVWLASGRPDQSLVVLLADRDSIRLGFASNGTRHPGLLSTVNADRLLIPSIGGKAVPLSRAGLQSSMLKRFCRAKDEKGLSWEDFISAVTEGKKKAAAIVEECADAYAVALFNLILTTNADVWLMEGSLIDDLPMMTDCIRDRIRSHAQKAGIDVNPLSIQPVDSHVRSACGAAAFLTEQLLALLE